MGYEIARWQVYWYVSGGSVRDYGRLVYILRMTDILDDIYQLTRMKASVTTLPESQPLASAPVDHILDLVERSPNPLLTDASLPSQNTGKVDSKDARCHQKLPSKDTGGKIKATTFSLNGKMLASGSQDRTVGLWDGRSGASLQILNGHESMIAVVAFSPDGKTFVLGLCDGGRQVRGRLV